MPFVRLLGGVSIEGEDGVIAGPAAQRHRLALLALLCEAYPSALGREKLLAYLWPDRDSEHARNLLNQAVHAVRRGLGEGAVDSVGDELRFGADVVQSDVIAFREAVAAGDHERAAELYTGAFLDGFFLSGANEFEHWAAAERERFGREYRSSLEVLAEDATRRGDVRVAVQRWRRLAAEDKYSARVTLRLMAALEAVGDRAAAIRQAGLHAALLEQQLGAKPDPEIAALAERMRAAPAVRPEAPSNQAVEPTGPLVAEPEPRGDPRGQEGVVGRAGNRWSVRSAPRPAVALGLAVTLIALAAFWVWGGRSPALDARRVVVAPFENRTGDASLDPIGMMAADWITQGLSQTAAVDVVPAGVALSSARQVQAGMGPPPGIDPVHALAEETGAGLVISGTYYLDGDSLQFQTQITDARRLRLLWALGPLAADPGAPMATIDLLRQRTMGALAPIVDARLASPAGEHYYGRPPNYEAYRAYAGGWDFFLAGAYRDAILRYERALELDSTYLAPQLTMAWAYANLGEFPRTDSIVRVLDRRRDRLTPYERASLDLLIAAGGEDRLATYEAARRVAQMAPGTLPHVQWGVEAIRLNRPREAIRILSGIDPTRGVVRGYFPYWTTLTGAHHLLGRHRRELKEARRARTLHPDELRYLLLEAVALAALGRVDELHEVIGARLALPEHRPPSPVALMLRVGLELEVHGHPGAARETFDRAIEWYRERPSSVPFDPYRDDDAPAAPAVDYRGDYAAALLFMGQLDEASEVLASLTAEDPGSIGFQGMLGLLAARRGDREEAERIDAWLAGQRRPRTWGNHTFFRACIAAELGRADEAVALLQEAFAQGATYWPRAHFMPCLQSLQDHPPFRQLMRPTG
jgi:DNA-binding SARP family transcriptional activator/tetratricopeptide (TPR) repeat protein